jgi:DNA-binding transcriptional regulator YiaG
MSAVDELLQRSRDRRALPAPAVRRALREAARISQTDVAEVVGVSQRAVSSWETGDTTPRGAALGRYLDLLDRLRIEGETS